MFKPVSMNSDIWTYVMFAYNILCWHQKRVISMKPDQLLFWWSCPLSLLFFAVLLTASFSQNWERGWKAEKVSIYIEPSGTVFTLNAKTGKAMPLWLILHSFSSIYRYNTVSVLIVHIISSSCLANCFLLNRTLPHYQLGISFVMFSTYRLWHIM